MELFLIDGMGPFFKGYKKDVINWSRIPFESFEKKGRIDQRKIKAILDDFSTFCKKVSKLGYNAITLDDLAHITSFSFYKKSLQKKLEEYKELYTTLISIAKKYGLKIYINSDIMFYNDCIKKNAGFGKRKISDLLAQACEQACTEYDIGGIIFRIGEHDGLDVQDEFISELTIKNPKQMLHYLKKIIPIFEKHDKYAIVRTWTVGAYSIGDLMWNEKTFRKTFDIHSEKLIISMKPSRSDFYRGMVMNDLFNKTPHKKIIEVQSRNEREFFGKIPYFHAAEYESYAKRLKNNKKVVGMMCWCQTGGWTKWHDRTFIEGSSPWNEINTKAAIDVFKDNKTADEILKDEFSDKETQAFVKEYDRILKQVIHGPRNTYFRRLCLPSNLWIFWDRVEITVLTRMLGKLHAYAKVPEITKLEKNPVKISNKEYYMDSLRILIDCRKCLEDKLKNTQLIPRVLAYRKKYPHSFSFTVDMIHRRPLARYFVHLFTRKKEKYRIIDRLFSSHPLKYMITLFFLLKRRKYPGFANKQAMNIKTIIK